jgi:hypothetical protein
VAKHTFAPDLRIAARMTPDARIASRAALATPSPYNGSNVTTAVPHARQPDPQSSERMRGDAKNSGAPLIVVRTGFNVPIQA